MAEGRDTGNDDGQRQRLEGQVQGAGVDTLAGISHLVPAGFAAGGVIGL